MKEIVMLAFLLVLLVSCDPDDPTQTTTNYNYTCMVVNMGNYSESNGSIALYNSITGTLEQEVYAKANGRNLGAIIESVVLDKDIVLLMCNNSDKLVFLNTLTMKEVCEPISTIGVPRYAALKGDYAYVSCWDKTNKQTGDVVLAQHISKISLSARTEVKRLATTGKPEGMALSGDTLFVASGSGLDIYDLTTDTLIKHLASQFIGAEAQQVVIDKNKQVWVSLGSYGGTGGFMLVNVSTLQITTQLSESKLAFEGDIALSPAKDKLYFIYADGIVGGQTTEVTTHIYTIDVNSYQVSSSAIINGVGFYGLGVDLNSGTIYTANVNGFITNSMTYLYNSSGAKTGEFMTGVGSCRFVFK